MSLLGRLAGFFLPAGEEGQVIRRNAGWLAAERVFRLVVALVINVWIVRYLGAAGVGLLGFTQSLVGLFGILAYLGLESIVVRELVRGSEESGELLGTSATLRLGGALLSMVLAVATVAWVRPADRTALALTAILGSVLVFQALDVIDHWFQSRSNFMPFVAARGAAFVVASALKVWSLLSHASIVVLALAMAAEFPLAAAGLAVAYRVHGGRFGRWKFRGDRARRLLADSWPLILTTAAIVIYSRTDQVMLTLIRGDRENGIYAAAQRLSEVLNFIPVAALAAANPALLRTHREDPDAYRRRLGRLFGALAWTAILLAAPISLASGEITTRLFGATFAASGPVLALHVWAAPAVFLGVAQSNWFIAGGFTRGLLLRAATGAALNVALNFALIPAWGAAGAAVATLVSQWIASVALNSAFPATRPLFRLQCRAFLPGMPR